jgi:hypothetical protein
MRSSDETNTPPPPNAFDPGFLKRIAQVDEPATGAEADVAGPWHLAEIPGTGFGLFRLGETRDRRFQATAIFHDRSHALIAAAVLPGTCRDAAFRLALEPEEAGFALTDRAGDTVGHFNLFDENLRDALHVVETILRSPEALANLLEAAGSLALERAGAILDQRFPQPAEDR